MHLPLMLENVPAGHEAQTAEVIAPAAAKHYPSLLKQAAVFCGDSFNLTNLLCESPVKCQMKAAE
jgi:hypothetical protein